MTNETEIESEKSNLLPNGSLFRVLKPTVVAKEAGFTKEVVPALNRALCKIATELMADACEIQALKGGKRVTIDALKAAGEKRGIEIQ